MSFSLESDRDRECDFFSLDVDLKLCTFDLDLDLDDLCTLDGDRVDFLLVLDLDLDDRERPPLSLDRDLLLLDLSCLVLERFRRE